MASYQQVLNGVQQYLSENGDGCSPLDIARKLGQPKKIVNKILYSMLEDGAAVKVNDKPPIWRPKPNKDQRQNPDVLQNSAEGLAIQNTGARQKTRQVQRSDQIVIDDNVPQYGDEFEEPILKYLYQSGGPVKAIDIAHYLGFQSKSKINPILYRLCEQGKIFKVCHVPPKWQLSNASSVTNQVKMRPKETYPANILTATSSDSEITDTSENVVMGNAFGSTTSNQELLMRKAVLLPHEMLNLERTSGLCNACNNGPAQMLEPNHNFYCEWFSCAGPRCKLEHTDGRKALQLEADELSIGTSSDFSHFFRNPVTAFLEFADSQHISGHIPIVSTSGPDHSPRFTAVAVLGDRKFQPVTAKTKKEAKLLAAEMALKVLAIQGSLKAPGLSHQAAKKNKRADPTFFDNIAYLSHHCFHKLTCKLPVTYTTGRKIMSCFVMVRDKMTTVISLGTGNTVVTGDCLSQEGLVVNDSHAEIIARRGFRRFLYKELMAWSGCSDNSQSIFEKTEGGYALRIKSDIAFHLYITNAPCGDGAVFSHNELLELQNVMQDDKESHVPFYGVVSHARLRTKLELGVGTNALSNNFEELTWDGISRGDQRLRTMSCSDKIAKWNVLGLQGALLSHFITPIYLSSVTIGYLFSKGHLARALCCRLARAGCIDHNLPSHFHLNHPQLGQVTACEIVRQTDKTKHYSINWTIGDENVELIDGRTGLLINLQGSSPSESRGFSRLCKREMFVSFQQLCSRLKLKELLELKTYLDAKRAAVDYCRALNVMERIFYSQQMGPWVHKPCEEKEFSLDNAF